MQYAVRRRTSSAAYCALSIKCGTRDEEGFHGGIAHFVEHTIFKGTSRRSKSFVFAVNVEENTEYEVEYTAKSDLGELAQLPVTLFYQGFPIQTFAFQGSGGQPTSVKRKLAFRHRYAVYRLYFPQNGLQMLSVKFRLLGHAGENTDEFLT